MFKNRGIAFKLILFFSAIGSLIFIAIFSYNYHVSKKIIQRNTEDNARNLSLATVHRIEAVLKPVQKVPENLALVLERGSYPRQEILRLLRGAVERNPEIYGMAIAFEPYAYDGRALYFAPYFYKKDRTTKFSLLGSEAYRYFYLDWYQIPRELDRPDWTEPYYDEGGGNILTATYSVPFYGLQNGKRRFMGVVTADVSLDWLNDIVSSIKILRTGYGVLLSKNGMIVTHPSKDLIMNETLFSIAEARGDAGVRNIARSMIKGETGFVPYKNIYGKPSRMFYAPIPSSGWSLAVLFPLDELTADVARLNHSVVFGGIAGILLVSLAAALIARSITKPLSEISKAAGDIGAGNLDAELPPVSSGDEVGRLTSAFHYMRDSLKEHIAKLTETTAAKERIESELKIAHDIQMSILPKIFPPFLDKPDTFDLAAVIEPAKEVGGDFYDFFYIDDAHFCFVIGDVSGKGVPASLFMAVTKTLIKTSAMADAEPGGILTKVNRDLSEGNEACMFVTLFLGILDAKSGEVRYASGGHNPPVLVPGGGSADFLDVPKGLVVGVMEETVYKTKSIMLKPGGSLFMYTDGVTEAMNEQEELFTEQRLLMNLNAQQGAAPKGVLSHIMEEIVFFAGKAEQSDDITMMMVRYKGGD